MKEKISKLYSSKYLKDFLYPSIIIVVGFIAWFPVINNWFFLGYEASWLTSYLPYNFINLLRSHSFLYYLDYLIFGWNPWGWYFTSIVLHVAASILLFILLRHITKNKTLSFISAIIFVASSCYVDVLISGSRNSYYSLLLIWIFLGLITFFKYKISGKLKYYFASLVFVVLALITRETGIVMVFLITFFDLLILEKRFSKINIKKTILRHALFYIVLISFFIIRPLYGGTTGDLVDSNVKLQTKLVVDGQYLEYARISLLTLGKLVPPMIIPYPALNFIREFLYGVISVKLLEIYFFPFLGLTVLSVICTFIYKLRETIHLKPLLFFITWSGLFLVFFSLSVPSTPDVHVLPYNWDTMRYRYFTFVGFSFILGFLITEFYKKIPIVNKLMFKITFVILLVLNIFLIWNIESLVYALRYKPQIDFYAKFKEIFPILPQNYYLYYYPFTQNLNDYLSEWCIIKDYIQPQMKGLSCPRITTSVERAMILIKDGRTSLNNFYFLDLNEGGLIDNTDKARNAILNQKEYELDLKKDPNVNVWRGLFDGPYVEFPYIAQILLSQYAGFLEIGSSASSTRFRALVDYNAEQKIYRDKVNIKTSQTEGENVGKTALFYLPENLIDGNIGPRSSWLTREIPGWIIADLGGKEEVYGVSWGSSSSPTRVPSHYAYFASDDSASWKKIKEVSGNDNSSRIDQFPSPITARYIKMIIYTTSGGDFTMLDEFEVIGGGGREVLALYKERNSLFNESRNMFMYISSADDLYYFANNQNYYWGKLMWETNKTKAEENNQFIYFQYSLFDQEQKIKIKIPESEYFSASGQFLKKKINSLSIDFGNIPYDVSIDSLQFLPGIKL